MYQGAERNGCNDRAIEACEKQALDDCKSMDEEMRARLECSDLSLLRSILVFLDTQSWPDSEELSSDDTIAEIKSAVLSLSDIFRALEAKGADLRSIVDEVGDAIDYMSTYVRSKSESYKTIWYQLYTTSEAVKWPNILLIIELFSLPFSTAKVECLFSTLKVIKNERRTNLHCYTLNDLLEVNTEGPSLSSFSPESAIDLCWNDCSSGQ